MYVCVCSAIVEVRGGHAAVELVFLLPYQPSTSNHQPFTGLVGAAWRGAGCIAIVVDLDADMDASLKSDVFCGLALFISVSFALLCPLFLRPFRPSSLPTPIIFGPLMNSVML